uniref:Fe2OG dioxygenase domain-containing protein n=1 Tax=Globodera pallida TaxID=36090 RepID=A0A183CM01_GLOPA
MRPAKGCNTTIISATLLAIFFLAQMVENSTRFPSSTTTTTTTMLPENVSELLQNKDIQSTWQKHFLNVCLQPGRPKGLNNLTCFCRQLGYEKILVEVLSRQPVVLRIPQFVSDEILNKIAQKVRTSREVKSQGVEGFVYSEGHMGRRADGLWMTHNEEEVRALYRRIQAVLTLNPAMGEDFLVLRYAPFGHYAPHYDHLDPMPPSYDDGWFAYFGNRLATALLLVDTAERGGSTVFPNLGLNIVPEKGDLLLWMNADSNDRREQNALHAACPVVVGEKIAVSLWIRGNFQNTLKCARTHPGYEPEELVRRNVRKAAEVWPEERPTIPRWVFED